MSDLIDIFAKLIEDHFTRVTTVLSPTLASDWNRSVMQRVLDNHISRICFLGDEKMNLSISDGQRHSVSELFNDLFISISTFPSSIQESKRIHYPNGYLPYLDQMVSVGRQYNPDAHWLHFQFFRDSDMFFTHFTLFPNKRVLDFSPRYELPIELLSDEEKRNLGIK